jgi:hypothetical protein
MKNYLRILETSKKDQLHKTFLIRKGGATFTQWKAINLAEEMANTLLARLGDVVSDDVEVKVCKVNLNLFDEPGKDGITHARAQLYENEHRKLLLKVFIHEENNRGKSRKIARAIYELQLVSKEGHSRVA